MLKIQELRIEGFTFRIREPRLRDFLSARNIPAEKQDEYVITMLSSMMVDENGEEVGKDYVLNLPLRFLDPLSALVADLTKTTPDPLPQSDGSSIGSPSQSGVVPSLN